jgi:hypothetical protein
MQQDTSTILVTWNRMVASAAIPTGTKQLQEKQFPEIVIYAIVSLLKV